MLTPRRLIQATSACFATRLNSVLALLDRFQVQHQLQDNGQIRVTWCPLCPKPHYGARDNMNTLHIKAETGQFNCFRCSAHGSYYDLKNQLFGLGDAQSPSFSQSPSLSYTSSPSHSQQLSYQHQAEESEEHFRQQRYLSQPHLGLPPSSFTQSAQTKQHSLQDIRRLESSCLERSRNLEKESHRESLEYLTGTRGLSLQTLRDYHVGLDSEAFADLDGKYSRVPVMAFPMFRGRSKKERKELRQRDDQTGALSSMWWEVQRVKLRGVGKENKGCMRMEPSGVESLSLFGLHLIEPTDSVVVLTEGELDAMSVYQQTGVKSVSLPNGASHLPLPCLAYFQQFAHIYLWMDNDAQGQLNVDKIANKLGKQRVRIVKSQFKDANEALLSAPESIATSLAQSETLLDSHIVTFENLRNTLKDKMLHHDQDQGIQSGELGFLNARLKGLRKGEFTVVTGGTGSGKTTLLSQISLDYCQQGVRTLWGSFEVQNHTLLQTMLLQYSKTHLFSQMQQYDYFSDRIQQLPLFFMNYYGATDVEQMLSTIEYTIYKYDINLIVLDNLQFFLGSQAQGYSKFDLQDQVVSRLRNIATEQQVHIMLVIHPRKVDEKEDLQVASVFGSAKATQEADNIFIIQNRNKYKELQLRKNRFSGDMGEVFLGFDKDTKRFIEMTQVQQKLLESNAQSFGDIYQQQAHEEQQQALMLSALQHNSKNFRQRQNKFQQERQDQPHSASLEEQLLTIQAEYQARVTQLQQQHQAEEKKTRLTPQEYTPPQNLYNQAQSHYNTHQETLETNPSHDQIKNYVLYRQAKNQQFSEMGFYNESSEVPKESFIEQQLSDRTKQKTTKTQPQNKTTSTVFYPDYQEESSNKGRLSENNQLLQELMQERKGK